MATLCGWASIDERGKISGGTAGDQTGKEVKIGNWYDFGQTIVLRFKDRTKAKKYAKFIKAICNNSCVGYDQINKTTLAKELEKVNWDYTKLTAKCEVDCSELTRVGLYYVGIKINTNIYTGNMVSKYMATGEFEKLTSSKYVDGGDYLMAGDISISEGHHTISALEDGAKVSTNSSNSSVSTGTSSTLAFKVGDTVKFTGTVHYTNASKSATGKACKAGRAKVTAVSKGSAHPYHLVAVSGKGSTVYGWVNSDKVSSISSTTSTPKVGDKIVVTGYYYDNGNGGTKKKVTNKTMYVTEIVSSNTYKYYIGVSPKKGGARWGWISPSSIV